MLEFGAAFLFVSTGVWILAWAYRILAGAK